MNIKSIAVSSGSACTSESLEPSYVLRALGVKDEMAHTSIRFGIGYALRIGIHDLMELGDSQRKKRSIIWSERL